jgi:hypothetical protein
MVNSKADGQQNGPLADPRHQKALFQFGTCFQDMASDLTGAARRQHSM